MRLCEWKTRAMLDRHNIATQADVNEAVALWFNGRQAANNLVEAGPTQELVCCSTPWETWPVAQAQHPIIVFGWLDELRERMKPSAKP